MRETLRLLLIQACNMLGLVMWIDSPGVFGCLILLHKWCSRRCTYLIVFTQPY